MTPERSAQVVLGLYAACAAAVLAWQAGRCRSGRLVWLLYQLNRLYCGLFHRRRGNRRSPFPASGSALVIANHRSPVDPMLLWMDHHLADESHTIRVLGFMMAREFFEKPALNWLFRAVECIPVERKGRDAAAARQALRRLAAGELLGVFPEGRINRQEDLLPADAGVAWLALRSRAPVYPVFIRNAPTGRNIVEPFYRRSKVRVIYGDQIDLSGYYHRKATPEVLREVTDLLMNRLAALGGVRYPAQKDGEAQRREDAETGRMGEGN